MAKIKALFKINVTKIVTAGIIALACVACKSNLPPGVLSPQAMEDLLYDIHIVDGYLAQIGDVDSMKIVGPPLYKGVYQKHHTDSASQHMSMQYYYKHPDQLAVIYTKVLERLKKTKDKVASQSTLKKVEPLN